MITRCFLWHCQEVTLKWDIVRSFQIIYIYITYIYFMHKFFVLAVYQGDPTRWSLSKPQPLSTNWPRQPAFEEPLFGISWYARMMENNSPGFTAKNDKEIHSKMISDRNQLSNYQLNTNKSSKSSTNCSTFIGKINMSAPHDIRITWCTMHRQHAQLPPQGPEAAVLLKPDMLTLSYCATNPGKKRMAIYFMTLKVCIAYNKKRNMFPNVTAKGQEMLHNQPKPRLQHWLLLEMDDKTVPLDIGLSMLNKYTVYV